MLFRSETNASKVMQEFAIAALLTDPGKYILNTPRFFLFAHGENPTFNDPLYLYSMGMKNNCGNLGHIRFCKPLVLWNMQYKIWDMTVNFVNHYYLKIAMYANYLLLFPSIIFVLVQKDGYFKLVAALYLLSILLFVSVEAPLPRYTYIFTPLFSMLSFFALFKLYEKVTGKK